MDNDKNKIERLLTLMEEEMKKMKNSYATGNLHVYNQAEEDFDAAFSQLKEYLQRKMWNL
jgi:hypothetical protein